MRCGLCLLSVASLTLFFPPHPVGPVFIRCVLRGDEEGNGEVLGAGRPCCILETTSFFPLSGWRHGLNGKSAQYVKLGSAEKRLSPFMGEGARSPRIPGETEEGAEGKWKTFSLGMGRGIGENISY